MLALSRAAEKARFELGIGTYTVRGVSEEQMIADLRQLQITQIELSSPNYFLPVVKLGAMQSLRAKLDQGGIKVISYFAGDVDSQEELDKTVAMAKALGVSHVSGSAVGDALRMIDVRFTHEGMKFGIHNHWFRGRRFAYESPEDLLNAFAKVSKTVGATLDAGHMASCGYDPIDALNKLWARLQIVHLKDVQRAADDKNVVLGTGVAKSKEVIEFLEKHGFNGLVAVEYEASPENPVPDVTRSVTFARQWMRIPEKVSKHPLGILSHAIPTFLMQKGIAMCALTSGHRLSYDVRHGGIRRHC